MLIINIGGNMEDDATPVAPEVTPADDATETPIAPPAEVTPATPPVAPEVTPAETTDPLAPAAPAEGGETPPAAE